MYPSSLIGKYISTTKHISDEVLYDLNATSFYMFWGGVFVTKNERDSIYYVLPAFTLLLLLILEKNA